jgi:hypothetical protein
MNPPNLPIMNPPNLAVVIDHAGDLAAVAQQPLINNDDDRGIQNGYFHSRLQPRRHIQRFFHQFLHSVKQAVATQEQQIDDTKLCPRLMFDSRRGNNKRYIPEPLAVHVMFEIQQQFINSMVQLKHSISTFFAFTHPIQDLIGQARPPNAPTDHGIQEQEDHPDHRMLRAIGRSVDRLQKMILHHTQWPLDIANQQRHVLHSDFFPTLLSYNAFQHEMNHVPSFCDALQQDLDTNEQWLRAGYN